MNVRWLALGFTLAAALPVQAQKITPGLWEYGIAMKGGPGSQMEAAQAQMAAMPPKEREMMERMMAQRGLQMGGPGKPMLVKTCVTAEQASRDELPQPDANCKHTSQSRSGNTVKFKFECTGERAATGEGEYTFASTKEMKGFVRVSTTVKGKPETMQMDHTGRWLGADCGDIKPRVKK